MTRRLTKIRTGHPPGLEFGIAMDQAMGNLAAGLPIGFLFGLSMIGDDDHGTAKPEEQP